MSKLELLDAYVNGRISRRAFIRGLTALGISQSSAVLHAAALRPGSTALADDLYNGGDTRGGDATSSSGAGGRGGSGGSGGDGNGGLAILHDRITTTARSETSLSLEGVSTGDIHNEITINVEPTDETVVINIAGNPGSNSIHSMNVGAPVQSINTGGITSSADASGTGGAGGAGGHGGDSGDASSRGGSVNDFPFPR